MLSEGEWGRVRSKRWGVSEKKKDKKVENSIEATHSMGHCQNLVLVPISNIVSKSPQPNMEPLLSDWRSLKMVLVAETSR